MNDSVQVSQVYFIFNRSHFFVTDYKVIKKELKIN